MKKTVIFGGFAALLCLAAAARAEGTSPPELRDGAGRETTAMKSGRPDGMHDRDAQKERSRNHEAGEREHEARSDDDAQEASEHRHRR